MYRTFINKQSYIQRDKTKTYRQIDIYTARQIDTKEVDKQIVKETHKQIKTYKLIIEEID